MDRPDETEGVLLSCEVPLIVRRDSPRDVDISQAMRSGAENALRDVLQFIDRAEGTSPPYTDLRPYANLRTYVLDRIAENAGVPRG